MAKARRAQSGDGRRKDEVGPPAYPRPPHLLGVDWIELPVSDARASAALYEALGFQPRPPVGRSPRVGLGGVVIVFRQDRTGGEANGDHAGVLLQLVVDDADAKRSQLCEMGLRPGPLRRQPRGDTAFEWRDPDGHRLRFVGPTRRPDDNPVG